MIGYILALIPLFIVLYVPLSNLLFGPSPLMAHTSFLSFNESFIAPDDVDPLACPVQNFSTHILSREPLLLYLEGFLGRAERGELLDIRYVSPLRTVLFFCAGRDCNLGMEAKMKELE